MGGMLFLCGEQSSMAKQLGWGARVGLLMAERIGVSVADVLGGVNRDSPGI
jgi:hypothetical protein